MPKSKKNTGNDLDISITVEDELVDDFEKINFGAKGLEVLEVKLRQGNEAILEQEEKKSKLQKKSKKILGHKIKENKERAAEKASEEVENTLPQHNIYHHAPTFRNK